jgi:signal transduction histidine kinase
MHTHVLPYDDGAGIVADLAVAKAEKAEESRSGFQRAVGYICQIQIQIQIQNILVTQVKQCHEARSCALAHSAALHTSVPLGLAFGMILLVPRDLRAAIQLRNPLHALVGAVTVLESGDAGVEDVRWQVKSLRQCADAMCALTNSFLDLYSLHLGQLKLHDSWTDLKALLDRYVYSETLGFVRIAHARL